MRKTGPIAFASDCSKQLNVAFMFARHLGMGHGWRPVLVLCQDVTVNNL